MERSVVFAGFGGQGILFAGHVLAEAANGRGPRGPLDPVLRAGDARRDRLVHGHRGR